MFLGGRGGGEECFVSKAQIKMLKVHTESRKAKEGQGCMNAKKPRYCPFNAKSLAVTLGHQGCFGKLTNTS